MSQEENVTADLSATPFSVSSEGEGGATVISVVGELDLSTAPQLEECLQTATATTNVLVDLGACEFIDSTGIAVLVRMAEGRPKPCTDRALRSEAAGSPSFAGRGRGGADPDETDPPGRHQRPY